MTNGEATNRLRSLWERYAPRYDRDTGFYDLLLLGDSRSWACSQASGQILEVAIGTGRNLPFYPREIQLTGIDFSPAMLDIARGRAAELGIDITLIEADAQQLLFADHRFDTVVCTLALSSIPEPAAAINEMYRVLRPGGQLLVVGHVASPYRMVRAGRDGLKDCRFAWPVIIRRGSHTQKSSLLASPLIDVNTSEQASLSASVRSSPPTGDPAEAHNSSQSRQAVRPSLASRDDHPGGR